MSQHDSLPPGISPLDELEILVVVDTETDTLSSVDSGIPQSPEVVHLAARTPSSRRYEGHECKRCSISFAAPVTGSRC